ncbi:unnamed protein product [Moneuplotes crassus]|uniref:CCT domain-containing protein n=1 Tax=Euplotes crassus TaxID=5936 RepID=A0AAD1XTZ9_EUPCR|nr:unnamed protein product [Moneuplotes crassus]
MINSCTIEKEEPEPDKQPPDKFKIPKPKANPRSAFQSVPKRTTPPERGDASSLNKSGCKKPSTYDYILMKALRNPSDITPNEKMIIANHPVIADLIEQTNGKKEKMSCYINIDTIFNYQYCHSAEIPVLYDSREKCSFNQEQVLQYTAPHDAERLSDSTKGYSDYYNFEEEDQKTIGKYTLRERKEKIRKYKLKLQKYKLGLSKISHKYKQRSVIAKTRPRVRGKFAKNSQSADMTAH